MSPNNASSGSGSHDGRNVVQVVGCQQPGRTGMKDRWITRMLVAAQYTLRAVGRGTITMRRTCVERTKNLRQTRLRMQPVSVKDQALYVTIEHKPDTSKPKVSSKVSQTLASHAKKVRNRSIFPIRIGRDVEIVITLEGSF